ncbi:SDR family oxidoreductase [Shouchella sp. 1P09AA]|uniref:SDR family oxidoreductase n=1 Tax=unclassified Shouchella TaxID=2893065 RepID=UPI0039A239FD
MKLPFIVDLTGKVAVVTGGSGVLGGVMSHTLAKAGATVVVLARNEGKISDIVTAIKEEGGKAVGYSVDVLDKQALEKVYDTIRNTIGTCDILLNCAGGNHPNATTSHEKLSVHPEPDEKSFFSLEGDSVKHLFNLNFMGVFLPTQVFAQDMVGKSDATIINISSMNADRPLTKIPAYSGAKAAVSNFTEWLAVYFADVGIRVNAISPGFFLTSQNESLMLTEKGDYTERANNILRNTPVGRFGKPEELVGTLLWLVSHEASGFINGVVIPVDGGFSAYSGV